jgi:hypothetical protein
LEVSVSVLQDRSRCYMQTPLQQLLPMLPPVFLISAPNAALLRLRMKKVVENVIAADTLSVNSIRNLVGKV